MKPGTRATSEANEARQTAVRITTKMIHSVAETEEVILDLDDGKSMHMQELIEDAVLRTVYPRIWRIQKRIKEGEDA